MEYLKITKTSAICPKCKQKLHASDVPSYPFVCHNCDENFYAIEANHNSQERFNIFIPLDKKAKDLIPLIDKIAKKYNAKCGKYSDKSGGVYIIFESLFYAVDICKLNAEIQTIPHVKLGMTMYEKVTIENKEVILKEKLCGILPKEKLCRILPNGIQYKNTQYDLYLETQNTKSYKNINDINISLFDNPECMPEKMIIYTTNDNTLHIEFNDRTLFNEPCAWIQFSDGTSLVICHEEKNVKEPYYSVRLYCSEEDFDNNTYHSTCGIIHQEVCDDIATTIETITKIVNNNLAKNIQPTSL